MDRSRASVLTRVAAVWLGIAAAAMGVVVGRMFGFVVRVQGERPAMLYLVPVLFGTASVLGILGAAALWRGRQLGRVACAISGAALLVGFGPAAVLRGQALLIALLGVTLAAVIYVCSRPAARFCALSR